jgi:hypothetical protein
VRLAKAKVDENGSPCPNLPSLYSTSLEVEDSAVHADAEKLDENADTGLAFEGFNNQEPDHKDSVNIKLSAVVSNLETNKALMATKQKSTRNRLSIGVRSLLDQSFPAAIRTIDAATFKPSNLADKTVSLLPPPRPATSQPAVLKDLPERSVIACHAVEKTGIVNKGDFDFDMGQLNLSLGTERPTLVVPGHIRRLQSNTPSITCR